jgi:hypothetical protein
VAPASTRASTASSWLLARGRGVQPVLLERLRSAPASSSARVTSTGQASLLLPWRLSSPVPRGGGTSGGSASPLSLRMLLKPTPNPRTLALSGFGLLAAVRVGSHLGAPEGGAALLVALFLRGCSRCLRRLLIRLLLQRCKSCESLQANCRTHRPQKLKRLIFL